MTRAVQHVTYSPFAVRKSLRNRCLATSSEHVDPQALLLNGIIIYKRASPTILLLFLEFVAKERSTGPLSSNERGDTNTGSWIDGRDL
jgi:hypothetical protein